MKIAYFDCFSGAAGDMIVASLLDAGVDLERFLGTIHGLNLPECQVSAEKTIKQGLAATRFSVALSQARQPHRHLKHIVEIIRTATISEHSKQKVEMIFTRLAQAEAAVHNTTQDKVHFHEVGAVDAIMDVVGAVVALQMLGIDKVFCSAIPVGSGAIQCEHGELPVPAPATAELLKGIPLAPCEEPGELTTPTGAAILTTLAEGYGPMPGMVISSIGYGAGTRDGKNRPNVLRVLIGETAETEDGTIEPVLLLETNLDDATPQTVAHCSQRLAEAGAWDVWTQPILMKKQRSGLLLSVLGPPEKVTSLENIIFSETPTLGIRRQLLERRALARHVEVVVTEWGAIRMKVRMIQGKPAATPEFDDCQTAARKHGVPLQQVMTQAISNWQAMRAYEE